MALPGSIGSKDILIFTRQFAAMIDAGLPLVQCLDILASQTENAAFRKVIFTIKGRVEGGSSFSDALKDHPAVFDELYTQLCAAGEVGGILDTILNRLAVYREKAEKLARKVKGALTYPIAVMCIGVIVTAVLLIKVTPVFAKMFADFGGTCRRPQFVVDMSVSKLHHPPHRRAGGGDRRLRIFYKNPKGRQLFDKPFSRTAGGDLIRKVAVALHPPLGTMISSGAFPFWMRWTTAKTAGNRTIERNSARQDEDLRGKNT